MKRPCRVCGKVHEGMPFTDCADVEPDDLITYYQVVVKDY